MKKKLIAAITLAAVLIAGAGAALATAGSADDPFVTLDYLTDTYCVETEAALLRQVQSAAAKTEQAALDRLDTLAVACLARAGARESADSFLRLTLARGNRLSLPTGSSLLFESGQGTLTFATGALVDVTDGSTVTEGGTLTPGHHYVAAERTACAFTASGTAILSVLGPYDLDLTTVPEPPSFSDVEDSAFYAPAVAWAVEHSITAGTGNNRFSPLSTCTRAEIVTFLYRAAGSPAVDVSLATRFSDVTATAFYAKAVAWAVEKGITSGTGNNAFSPLRTCTRAEIVTFLYRYAGQPSVSASASFTDVAANAFYAKAVAWAVSNRVTAGTGNNAFSPLRTCTRAEAVTFLYRAIA